MLEFACHYSEMVVRMCIIDHRSVVLVQQCSAPLPQSFATEDAEGTEETEA